MDQRTRGPQKHTAVPEIIARVHEFCGARRIRFFGEAAHPQRVFLERQSGFYIEAGLSFEKDALRVRRFTEKPDAARAAEFVNAGNYFWNSGMFLWTARTLVHALLEHLPKTAALLQQIAATFG